SWAAAGAADPRRGPSRSPPGPASEPGPTGASGASFHVEEDLVLHRLAGGDGAGLDPEQTRALAPHRHRDEAVAGAQLAGPADGPLGQLLPAAPEVEPLGQLHLEVH